MFGDWSFVLTGSGNHHTNSKDDPEALMNELVRKLKASGQKVKYGKFTWAGPSGNKEDHKVEEITGE